MIDLGSIAGLYEREHDLHAYCWHCDRWTVLDLGAMVRRSGIAPVAAHGALSSLRRSWDAASSPADACTKLDGLDRAAHRDAVETRFSEKIGADLTGQLVLAHRIFSCLSI